MFNGTDGLAWLGLSCRVVLSCVNRPIVRHCSEFELFRKMFSYLFSSLAVEEYGMSSAN